MMNSYLVASILQMQRITIILICRDNCFMWTYTLLKIYKYIIAYFLIYDNEKNTIDFMSPKSNISSIIYPIMYFCDV